MATTSLELGSSKSLAINVLDFTPELIEEMNHTVIHLVRSGGLQNVSIQHKQLAWEVIKYLRQEWREMRSGGTNGDLTKAMRELMPQVNVQVNVERERRQLSTKAEHGLTRQTRERAQRQLAELNATVADQVHEPASHEPTSAAPQPTSSQPIEAAEKS